MANTPEVDYALVLADLKAKKKQVQQEYEGKLETLDNAIQGIEMIYIPSKTPVYKLDVSNMGVYEASCYVIEKEGKTLTTQELMDLLIKYGKRDVEYSSVAPTLYRAINEKKDCKIKRVGSGKEGKWGLSIWAS